MGFFDPLIRLISVKQNEMICFDKISARRRNIMQKNEMMNLIQTAKDRDPDAFTTLMQQYMKDMYRVAIAILMHDEDAADAIQETILDCWERIGTLRENRYFKHWLTRILINNCYDIRKRRENFAPMEEYEPPAAEDSYNLELKEALAALDEIYRIPMLLYYGQGWKTKEIAELLHVSISTIQTRLARGREKLAVYYRKE